MRRSLRTWGAVTAAAALSLGALVGIPAAQAANGTIVIWTDEDRAGAIRTLFPNGYKGTPVEVVIKPFGDIKDELNKVTAESAPDIVIGANDWIGELAANGKIVKLNLSSAAKAGLATGAVQAFNYNGAQYGTPVAVENIALITNASLVKTQPKTFDELSATALALKKAGKVDIPLAVQQGAGGDPYHMYPLFSGLGGYVFGTTASGAYNVKNVGIMNSVFRKNAGLIDQWNKSGLIRSTVTGDIAKAAFLAGKAPFWITGPWNLSDVQASGIKYRISAVPPIVSGIKPVPFIGVQGFMLTSFAKGHGVESAARSLVSEFMATEKAQYNLSALNDRYPANTAAAARVTNAPLKQFGIAGAGGVPIPNIPQMGSVWTPLGAAWVASTKGASAVPAVKSFTTAQAAVVKAIS